MPYYKTCALCGAHLDPQERCDCTKKPGDLAQQPGRHNTLDAKGRIIIPASLRADKIKEDYPYERK